MRSSAVRDMAASAFKGVVGVLIEPRRGSPAIEDLPAEEAGDEIDQEAGAPAPLVQERIELDDVERADEARIVEHLHDEMRLAISRPARHGRADAGRQRWIKEIG